MKAKELEALLAEASGRTASDIDQRVRWIRKAGLAKAGARGRNAPDIPGDYAALMIMAATTSVRAVDAQKGLERFHECRQWPHLDDNWWPFDYYMAVVLLRPDIAADIAQIRLNLTAGSARVVMRNGEVKHFIPIGADVSNDPESYGAKGICDECVISGDFLHRVALATHDATKAWLATGASTGGSSEDA